MSKLELPKRRLLTPDNKPPVAVYVPPLLVIGLLVTLGIYFVNFSSAQPAGGLGSGRLVASLEADREPVIEGEVSISTSQPLYVYVDGKNISSVVYTVRDAAGTAVLTHSDISRPYDLSHDRQEGSASPSATNSAGGWLPPLGRHSVTAEVTYFDGKRATMELPVTVR